MHRPTHRSFAVKKLCDVAIEAATQARTTMNSKLRWLDDIRAHPPSKDQFLRSNELVFHGRSAPRAETRS